MDSDTLLAEVDRAFALTSVGLSAWPSPRGPMESAREEEYSRCLDPGRYRLIGARMDAWAQVLVQRGVATVTDLPPAEVERVWVGQQLPELSALVELTPVKPGALSLLSGRTWIEGAMGAGLLVGVRGGVPEDMIGCACDACDWGSAGFLEGATPSTSW